MTEPAAAGQPGAPRSPAPPPRKRGCLFYFKWCFCTVYLLGATALSLFFVSFASVGGLPVSACVPEDTAIMLRVRSADALWHGLENDPRVLALWKDKDFQLSTGLEARWKELEEKWRKIPPLLRGRKPFGRASLAFVTSGEAAFAIETPARKDASEPQKKPPAYLLFRVNGGFGSLVRMLFWIQSFKEPEKFHDLGGGMLAVVEHGASLGSHGVRQPAAALPDDAIAELTLRPRTLLQLAFPQPKSFPPPPPFSEILCIESAPADLQLVVRAPGDGTVTLDGQWRGPLPKYSAPAPMLAWEDQPSQAPLLEAELPFGMRAAFLNWLDREMQVQANGSDKEKRRWENRLLELEKHDVDLNRDLWPAFGSRLRLAVLPPNEDAGEKIARLSLSLPFTSTETAKRAFTELVRVRWDGVAEGRAQAPEDWKVYVRHFEANGTDRFLLVKKNPPIPLIVLGPQAFAGVSDAGPLAPMWGAPELSFPKQAAPTSLDPPLMFLRIDGPRLAPQAGAFRQSELEDKRDEMGAARFMDKYPDEEHEVRLVEKLTRFLGSFNLELRTTPGKDGQPMGMLSGRWNPDYPIGLQSKAPVQVVAPPAP